MLVVVWMFDVFLGFSRLCGNDLLGLITFFEFSVWFWMWLLVCLLLTTADFVRVAFLVFAVVMIVGALLIGWYILVWV